MELPSTGVVANGKTDVSGHKPHQIYHINLDQAPVSQGGANLSTYATQLVKSHITMEKIADRYQVEVKHEGTVKQTAPVHSTMPSNQLTDGVVYTPIIQGIQLHPNVIQITSPTNQVNNTSIPSMNSLKILLP